jgi:hypothetical protein
VQAVDLAGAFLDLRLAIAREVAQLPNRLGRHEARFQQARLREPAQPGCIRDVGLAARDLLDVPRVDQQAVELVLQDRPRRLPIDAGCLHHHLLDPMRAQPVAQAEQSADRGGELGNALFTLAAVVRDAHARGDLRLVDIQRRRALDDQLHLVSFIVDDMTPPRGLNDKRIWQSCSQHSPELRGDPARQTQNRLTGTKASVGVAGDARNHRPFSCARTNPRKRTGQLTAAAT